MKQIASAYTYNKTSGVIVLSGLTIDRDQLLLVVNTTRNVTYYNFADSATTLQSYVIPSVYKGFYDGGGDYNIGDIVQTNGNPYGTAGGFFIRLLGPNQGYAPAQGGGSNSYWAPTSASGATITLNASVVSSASSHNNADALTIYYDDQVSSGVVNVLGRDANGLGNNGLGATAQIPIIAYDEGIGSAGFPYVVPVQVTNVGGQISEANPLPVGAGNTSFFVSGEDVYAHRSVLYSSSGNGFSNDAGAPVDIDNPLPISGTVTANLAQGIISENEDVGSLAPRLVAGVFDSNGTQFGDNKPFPTIPAQGTTVTSTGFASINSNQQSFSLVSASAGRRVLTVFNEGTGVLYISAGATCNTTTYQVRLGAGDYWEAPEGQLSLAHSAVFGTIGSAKVIQVT